MSTLEAMWKPLTIQNDGTRYGLGWAVGELQGHRVVGHAGGQAGSSTSLKLVSDRQLAIAVMTNLEGAALDDLANPILNLYLTAPRSQSASPH